MYCYLIWNTITDMGYVGITTGSLSRRLHAHARHSKHDRLITQSILKYGTEHFTVRVLGQTDTLDKLYRMEQQGIEDFNTLCPHGYNRTPGGDPVLLKAQGEATRRLISEGLKKHYEAHEHPNVARVFSEETRAKMSASARARCARLGAPGQGQPMTAANRKMHSERMLALYAEGTAPFYGKRFVGPVSEETRARMSVAHKGRKAWNKGVPWHEITGGKEHPGARPVEFEGQRYPSVMACHKATGISRPTIRQYIKWGYARYVDDEPMPDNVILTRTVAGVIGDSMSEQQEDSAKWPAMRFHPTLPPVTVQDEEEEKALPDGYRAKVWEEAEAEAWTAQHASHAEGGTPRSRR